MTNSNSKRKILTADDRAELKQMLATDIPRWIEIALKTAQEKGIPVYTESHSDEEITAMVEQSECIVFTGGNHPGCVGGIATPKT